MASSLSVVLIGLIGVAAFCATLLGGLFALRLKDRLHLILGFSAGAVVGVAFFDLLPESLELGAAYSPRVLAGTIAIGFLTYLVLDRLLLLHPHEETEIHLARAHAGAASLSLHSFLDGIGIGLAFKVSPSVGVIVAVAVLTHDFSDGINTVNFVLKNKGPSKRAFTWLLIDAVAPILGIVATLFLTVPRGVLGLLLALFAGFFLYIGASDLIPESYHAHPVRWTTVMTIIGAGTLYLIVQIANL
jgi:zinc transporter ZupT